MRFWFDTEFMEDGKTIELLSIGIVAEDGREFYAVNSEADTSKANEWVKENVLPYLMQGSGVAIPRGGIREEILKFVGSERPEFWGYYADYDWVVLCQLFGRMIDLPKSWPMYCRDIKQFCTDVGNPQLPPQDSTQHHALYDARWNRKAWEFCARQLEPRWKSYKAMAFMMASFVTEDTLENGFARADGAVTCTACSLPYNEHPTLRPTFHITCSGRVMKT